MTMPWFRMYSEARNDRKLNTLTNDEFRVWFNLMCLAGDGAERGVVVYESEDLLGIEVAELDSEILNNTLNQLVRLKIINWVDGRIEFVHWNERQRDKPSDAPEATRARKQKSRIAAKLSVTGCDDDGVTPVSREVTRSHAIDKKRREEIRVDSASPESDSAKPLPQSGPAQQIVAEWCRVAGLEQPANYSKAVGQAKALVAIGVQPSDIESLYAVAAGNKGSADLTWMIAAVDRWRAKPIPIPNGRNDHNAGGRMEVVL